MKISENRLNTVIRESIEDFLRSQSVDSFTPYTEKEAAINKAAIGRAGNRSYDKAPKANTKPRNVSYHSYDDWKANYKPKGISWAEYNKM